MLLPQDEGKAGVEEAEDRGSLSGAFQEAQQRHGEQDHAAAEEDRRACETHFFCFPSFFFNCLQLLIYFCHLGYLTFLFDHPTPPGQGQQGGQRKASWSGDFLHGRERADAWRAEPTTWSGGGCQEQRQPG